MIYPRFFCGVIPRLNGVEVSIPKISDSITLWNGLKPLWIRGNWGSQDIMTLSDGSTDLAVIGNCWASKETIKKEFRKNAISSKNFASLTDLPGSYNLIVSERDQTYIFTDIAGLRKIYYSVSESFVIYSSFSLVIQQLLKVDLNPYWLIANMAGDCMPDLFQHISPFQDIQTVPPGYCLEISYDSINCKQYWKVPQADLGIIQVAENLRHQLIESIEIRANNFTNITSDLSGGLDSTGLALLAAKRLSKQGRKLNTVTIESLSSANNEDDIRARHAVSLYPNIEARFFPVRDFPAYWSNLNEFILTDEPFKHMSKIGQYKQRMNFLTSIGSELHITGDAADAIFLNSPSYLADIIRNGKYLQFIKHTYGSSRLWNISFSSLIKSAISLSSTSYRSWAYRQARHVELRQKQIGRASCRERV